jgi:arylsulfatase
MNIVLYVLDSLRADHVSAYGYERKTTPVLDRLAADGVLFENCIAPGTWTRPVASSILSGLYPSVHGTYVSNDAYQPPTTSLPVLLQKAGYDNFAAVSGNMHSRAGFAKGFNSYVDDIDQGVTSQADNTNFAGTRGKEINNAFSSWLTDRDDTDDPFFAMLWSTGPHYPYAPPEGFREYVDGSYDGPADGTPECLSYLTTEDDVEQLVGLYDGEIRFNDYCIGELCDTLRDHGEYEDTLFIAIGDHGDGLGEHPGFFGHGSMTPYEGLVHVPCIVRTPSGVSGARIEEQVSLVDLYPTITDLATDGECDEVSREQTQGNSFAPAVDGDDIDGSDYVYASAKNEERELMYRMIRSNSRKHISITPFSEDREIDRTTGDQSTPKAEERSSAPSTLLHLPKTLYQKFQQWDNRMIWQIARHPEYYLRVYNRIHRDHGGYLFDLTVDSDEQQNLRADRPKQFAEWHDRLVQYAADAHRLRDRLGTETGDFEMGEELKHRLAQLGYYED